MPSPANQFAVICFIRCSIPPSRALARNDESDDAAERMKKKTCGDREFIHARFFYASVTCLCICFSFVFMCVLLTCVYVSLRPLRDTCSNCVV